MKNWKSDPILVAAEKIETWQTEFSCVALRRACLENETIDHSYRIQASMEMTKEYGGFYDLDPGAPWFAADGVDHRSERVLLLLLFREVRSAD
jgi:hypothetical protein